AVRLPAANDGVDIQGIDLQSVTTTASALGGDHRGTTAEEGVEHDMAARRTVQNCVRHQRNRLHGWMKCEQITLISCASAGVHAGVAPDVAAIAPVFTELNVIAMGVAAVLEDKDQLVLGAIEGAHPRIVLGPDAQVLELGVNLAPGGQQLG